MSIRDPEVVSELVEEQCLLWEHRKPAQVAAEAEMPVIAISRQAGTLAREVAQHLASERAMQLYDGNLVHEVAKASHFADRVVSTLDEKGRSYLDDLLASMEGNGALVGDEYFSSLARVINTIGRHGNAIILGHGAARVLRHHNVLRVRFVAPESFRIEHTRREHDLTEDEARELLHDTDSERKSFLRHYLGIRQEDPEFYDLIINNARFGVDDSVALVETALDRLGKRN